MENRHLISGKEAKVDGKPAYSSAVVAGNTIYLAGAVSGWDAAGNIIGRGDIEAQTVAVYESLKETLASARGLVVFAGTMSDGAEVVVIAHDSGIVSMYAHLDNRVFPVPVKAGDTIQAGDRIGNVGLTGNTTGAHLHWSVWRNGELIDPLSMMGG